MYWAYWFSEVDGRYFFVVVSLILLTMVMSKPSSHMVFHFALQAPEVCLCKLYGLSADVYSYSLLFYHVMTLDLPYAKYDLKKHMSRVVIGGERPNGKRIKAAPKLRDTIIRGWSADPHKRPSMFEICDAIQEEVVDRKQDVTKNKRRSTVAGILRRSQILQDQSVLSMVDEDDGEEGEQQ